MSKHIENQAPAKSTELPGLSKQRKCPARSYATKADILAILKRSASKILRQIDPSLHDAQLAMPLDEGKPRIRVSVKPGSTLKVTASVSIELGGRTLKVALERLEDFQEYAISS